MKKNYIFAIMTLLISANIYGNGLPPISVAKFFSNRQAAVSYTFDDGLREHYTMVFPHLKALGLKASFCIIGSKVGNNWKGTPCMTWEQLREMAADGQEISSHGWAHKNVTTLSEKELRFEVQHNDTVISDSVGSFPRTYFYPGNRKSETTTAFCMKDRVGTRMRQVDIGSRRDSTWLRQWINSLIEKGEWGIGMTHGITTGYDAFKDAGILWNHLKEVSRLQDQIWIATFHDVAAYEHERDMVQLQVKSRRRSISVKVKTLLDKRIFNMPLTIIIPDHITSATQKGKPLKI